jgi:glycosyltransferase involved in cell wall biosynthesis
MLTVLMASRNGVRTLAPTLEAFTQLQAPTGGWKLVGVDNASNDKTGEVFGSFQKRLPLTVVSEKRLGKNLSLNTALQHAEGDLAVFTDDDVFPRRDWLVQLRSAVDAQPSYSLFGGVILARWEIKPPKWVSWVEHAAMFTVTDPQLQGGPTTPGTIFGPNMAVRMEIFRRGVRFDPSIGPAGANYAMGSESELLERLGREGHKAWHVQNAVVEHFVRDFQLEESYAFKRAIRQGRGSYRLHDCRGSQAPWPWYAFPRMLKRLFRIAKAHVISDEELLFSSRYDFNFAWGQFVEAYRVRRGPKSTAPTVIPSFATPLLSLARRSPGKPRAHAEQQ